MIPKQWNLWDWFMQNQLGFGGGPTFITFPLKAIQVNCMINIV